MPRPARKFVDTPDPNPLVDWGVFPERDAEQADAQIADAAIAQLASAPADRPFFLARRLPLAARAELRVREVVRPACRRRASACRRSKPTTATTCHRSRGIFHWKLPEPRLDWMEKTGQLAAVRPRVSGIDVVHRQRSRTRARRSGGVAARQTDHRGALVRSWLSPGREGHHRQELAVGALDPRAADLRRPWHRARRLRASRSSCWISIPRSSNSARLPPVAGLEGHSLLPQLRDARAPQAVAGHHHAQPGQPRHPDRAVAISSATRMARRSSTTCVAIHTSGRTSRPRPATRPCSTNIAAGSQHVDRPPVPGSRFRLLTRDGDGWSWEGERIDPRPHPTANDHYPSSRCRRRPRGSIRDGDRRCRFQPAGGTPATGSRSGRTSCSRSPTTGRHRTRVSMAIPPSRHRCSIGSPGKVRASTGPSRRRPRAHRRARHC